MKQTIGIILLIGVVALFVKKKGLNINLNDIEAEKQRITKQKKIYTPVNIQDT